MSHDLERFLDGDIGIIYPISRSHEIYVDRLEFCGFR